MRVSLILVSAIAALTLTPNAVAATGTSEVPGVAGSELSVVAATPSAMTFTPSTDGTSSTLVTVTSTQLSWSLTVHDAGATTPGQMDKVDCVTRAPLGGSLSNPLAWSAPGAGTSGALSATPATVMANGSLAGTVAVDLTQGIDATEDIASGTCYGVTLTWTVT
jgi:hypothetical protein